MSLKVMKFWALWCRPCLAMNPVFEKVGKDYSDIDFEHINIDDDPKTASEFKVMSIPTIVFLKDDVEVDRSVGVMSEKDLRAKIDGLKG